jgi:ribosome biogenesis GTPase / thiamine phosphate phosphatase
MTSLEAFGPSLSAYGWTPFFARAFSSFLNDLPEADRAGLVPARVLAPGRGLHRVVSLTDHGWAEVLAPPAGRLEGAAERPAVGDWVVLDPAGPVIRAVLPRRTALSRKVAGARSDEQVLAANVDTVFLVLGLDGDFNLRRLERMSVLAGASGAEPVVLLTKADLVAPPELAERVAAAREVAPGVPVHAVAARPESGEPEGAPTGLAALELYLTPGRTVALLGSSGVGKSTLVNRLAGEEVLATGAVRTSDDRGRHTTSHRELVRLPGGSLLIDNPGLREVQLWVDDESTVAEAFPEIEALARECRFRDCTHQHEPGCAVRAAVESGELAEERLESLRGLEREVEALERRRDVAAGRAFGRKQGALYKRIQKDKDERGRR